MTDYMLLPDKIIKRLWAHAISQWSFGKISFLCCILKEVILIHGISVVYLVPQLGFPL